MANLEKITKKEFLGILRKALDSDAEEIFNMVSMLKKDATVAPTYIPTIDVIFDAVNHNALLYRRVECLDATRDIYFKDKNKLPTLKFNGNIDDKTADYGFE